MKSNEIGREIKRKNKREVEEIKEDTNCLAK